MFNVDALVKEYVQTTPRLAPYRKTIANVAGLLGALAAFLVTVPTEWLPVGWGYGIAVGVQATGTIVGYLVPNAVTPEQAQKITDYVDTYGRHAKPHDGVIGPDGVA